MKEPNEVTTIQLTGKTLKAHKLLSYCLLLVGLFLIITTPSEDVRMMGWGFISTLVGIVWLGITRFRIWWNHS